MQHLPKGSYTFVEDTRQEKTEEKPADNDSFTLAELMSLQSGLEGVDLLLGLSYCMESKEFYLETLKAFAEEDKLTPLEKAYADKDFDSYRITAHSIKSSAKTIGASLLSEKARVLEFAARDGDTAAIEQDHSEFISQYRALTESIRKVMIK